MPEGHSATDKALAWHTGSQGSNPDIQTWPKCFYPLCTLSLTMPVVTCSSVYTCHGGGKKRAAMIKSLQRHLEAKHRYKSRGRKEDKKVHRAGKNNFEADCGKYQTQVLWVLHRSYVTPSSTFPRSHCVAISMRQNHNWMYFQFHHLSFIQGTLTGGRITKWFDLLTLKDLLVRNPLNLSTQQNFSFWEQPSLNR